MRRCGETSKTRATPRPAPHSPHTAPHRVRPGPHNPPASLTCDAKASLSSYRSMSSAVRPAIFTAAGMATAGPMPMTAGSTPTAAKLRKMPRMGRPRFSASARVVSKQTAAPSET